MTNLREFKIHLCVIQPTWSQHESVTAASIFCKKRGKHQVDFGSGKVVWKWKVNDWWFVWDMFFLANHYMNCCDVIHLCDYLG